MGAIMFLFYGLQKENFILWAKAFGYCKNFALTGIESDASTTTASKARTKDQTVALTVQDPPPQL